MSKGGLSPGSSVSLPGRDSVPALNAKTLYPGRMLCSLSPAPPPPHLLLDFLSRACAGLRASVSSSLSHGSIIGRLLLNAESLTSCDPDNM